MKCTPQKITILNVLLGGRNLRDNSNESPAKSAKSG